MKMELKYLASYLPYGLKFMHEGVVLQISELKSTSRWKVWANNSTKCNRAYFIKNGLIGNGFILSKIKPLLLPLSALTEPMEDGSVPAIKLAELLIEKGIKNDIAPTIPFTSKIVTKPFGKMLKVTKCDEWYLMLSFDEPERVQHVIFEKLIEWHFDIYGIIDAGLAIDKRTLK